MSEIIRITAIHEKWRLECPNGEIGEGHTNWFPIDGVFRCKGCADQARHDPSIDPEYDRLRDKTNGQLITRDQVVLDINQRARAASL